MKLQLLLQPSISPFESTGRNGYPMTTLVTVFGYLLHTTDNMTMNILSKVKTLHLFTLVSRSSQLSMPTRNLIITLKWLNNSVGICIL